MSYSDRLVDIVKRGVNSDKSDKDIMIDLMTAGVPPSTSYLTLKKILKENKIRTSTHERAKLIYETLDKINFNPSCTKDAVEIVDLILRQVDGSTSYSARVAIRAWAKRNDVKLPALGFKSGRISSKKGNKNEK